MRGITLTLIILFTSIIIGWAQVVDTVKQDSVKYQKAPNFTLMSTENKEVTLDSLLKKGPVYLEFWDLTCKNCIKELDALMPVYEKYKDRGLQIIALSADKPADAPKVKTFAKANKWPYYILLDANRKVMELYNVMIKPTAYLISQKGEIVFTHIGFKQGEEKRIKEEMLKWLPPEEKACEEKESKDDPKLEKGSK
jgi:peroxiredoxin